MSDPKFFLDNATMRGLSKFFLAALRGWQRGGGEEPKLVEFRQRARVFRAPKNISDIFVAEIFISRYNGICLLQPKKDYARAALLEIAP